MAHDVIVLSDGESDDEVAFVGSHACAPSRNPSSPVFVRAQSGVGIIELTDDESGPEGRMISSDAPDFDAVFPPVVSDHQPTVDDEDDWGADLWDDREVLPVTNDSLLETPAGPSTASAIDITSSPVERVPLPARRSLRDIINNSHLFAPLSPPLAPPAPEAILPKRRGNDAENDPEDSDTATATRPAKKHQALSDAERAEREQAKEAREREREAAKAAKEQQKRAAEADKAHQKRVADVNRLRSSKTAALPDLQVYMAYNLSLSSSPIAAALPELRARIEEADSELCFLSEDATIVSGSIQFRRRVRAQWDTERKCYVPLDEERLEWESTTVLVASADDIVDRIVQDSLIQWLADIRLVLNLAPEAQLMLVVIGLSKYHRDTVSIVNRNFRDMARAAASGSQASGSVVMTVAGRAERDLVENMLLHAQVVERVFIIHVDKASGMEDWLFNLAADVAIRPHKIQSRSHLAFAAPEGVRKVKEPGETLRLMLQEVQGVTASAASGINDEYASFRDLMEAYASAERRGTAEDLLANCQIRTSKNGTASDRKLGRVLSKRVFHLLRSDDSLFLMRDT